MVDKMALVYFDVIIIYPIIAAVIAKLTLETPLKESIKGAYYLFAGYILTYAAILFLVLSTVKFVDIFVNFLIFTIGYFAVFFIRAYIQTEQHDLFATISPEK
jgi:hypothetical protein